MTIKELKEMLNAYNDNLEIFIGKDADTYTMPDEIDGIWGDPDSGKLIIC